MWPNLIPKKIKQVDAIFGHVHFINFLADQSLGVIRLSIDTKPTIEICPYSRGRYIRHGDCAANHDFEPLAIIKLFGILTPQIGENHFFLLPATSLLILWLMPRRSCGRG